MTNLNKVFKGRFISYHEIKQKVNNEILDLINKSAIMYDTALKDHFGSQNRRVCTAIFLASLKTDSIARRYLNELGINFEDAVEALDSLKLTEQSINSKVSNLDFTNLPNEEKIEQIYNEYIKSTFEELLAPEDTELSEKKNYNIDEYMKFIGIEHILYNLTNQESYDGYKRNIIEAILSAMEQKFVYSNSRDLQDAIDEEDKGNEKNFIKKFFSFTKKLKKENRSKKNTIDTRIAKKYKSGECSFNSIKINDLLKSIELYRLRLKGNNKVTISRDLQKIIENACEKYFNIKDKDVYVYEAYSKDNKRKLMESEKRVGCLLISCLENENISREFEKKGINTFPIKKYFSDIREKKINNSSDERILTQEDIRKDFDMLLKDFISISLKREAESSEQLDSFDLLEYIMFSHHFGNCIGFECISDMNLCTKNDTMLNNEEKLQFNGNLEENIISESMYQFVNHRKTERHTKKMYDYLCNNKITGVYHDFEEFPSVSDDSISYVSKWYANQNIDGKQIKNLILEKRQMISYYPGHKTEPVYIWHVQNIPFDRKAEMLACILNGNTGVYLNDTYELIDQLQKDDYDPKMEELINYHYEELKKLGVFINIDAQTDIMKNRHINAEAYREYIKNFSEHVRAEGLGQALQTIAVLQIFSNNFMISENGEIKKTSNGMNPKAMKDEENIEVDRLEL